MGASQAKGSGEQPLLAALFAVFNETTVADT